MRRQKFLSVIPFILMTIYLCTSFSNNNKIVKVGSAINPKNININNESGIH